MSRDSHLHGFPAIGRDVPFHCAPPINGSHLTGGSDEIPWNSSSVTYDTCVIRLDTNTSGGGNHSRYHSRSYGCLYGYHYDLSLDASFMSEVTASRQFITDRMEK